MQSTATWDFFQLVQSILIFYKKKAPGHNTGLCMYTSDSDCGFWSMTLGPEVRVALFPGPNSREAADPRVRFPFLSSPDCILRRREVRSTIPTISAFPPDKGSRQYIFSIFLVYGVGWFENAGRLQAR